MSVISIVSIKGGVGKTTLSKIIASSLAEEAADFVAIDTDPADALGHWRDHFYGGPAFELIRESDHDRLAHLIHKLSREKETILIDTAGFNNQTSAIAMAASDAVLIPIMASQADLRGAERTWQRCQGLAFTARREIPAWLVLNAVKKTSRIHQHVMAEVENLTARHGIRRLDTKLSNLVAYGEISWSGALPDHGPAIQEVRHLIDELREKGVLPAVVA